MPWQIQKLTDMHAFIQNGDLVIGVIECKPGRCWLVEIMWFGHGGDYRFESATYDAAVAFIQGVEAAQSRLMPNA